MSDDATPNEPTEPIDEPTNDGDATPDGGPDRSLPSQHSDDPGAPSTTTTTSNRATGRIVAFGVLAILLLATIGAAGYFISRLGGSGEELIGRVPADAQVFVSAYLDPSASQKINLRNTLERFPGLPGDGDPKEVIATALNDAMAEDGMSYEEDLQPWLGSQFGVALLDERPVVMIDSKDDGAAAAFLEEAVGRDGGSTPTTTEYEGVTITSHDESDGASVYAIHDGVVMVGEELDDLHAVIDTANGQTESLDANPGFNATMADLPTDRLVMAWVDPSAAALSAMDDMAIAGASPMPGMPDPAENLDDSMAAFEAIQGIGVTLSAETDGISLQVAAPIDTSKMPDSQQALFEEAPHTNAGLAWTPEDAFGVFTVNTLAEELEATLTAMSGMPSASPEDLLGMTGLTDILGAASGDMALQVTPGAGMLPIPGGTVLVATDDEAAMQSALDEAIPQMAADGGYESPGSLTDGLPGQKQKDAREVAPARTASTNHRGVEITALVPPASQQDMSFFVPAWAVTDGMAIVGSSPDAVQQAIDAKLDGESITNGPTFEAAVSHGSTENSAMLYVDIQQIVQTVRGFGADMGEEGAVLEEFRAVIYTQTTTTEALSAELFILMTDDGDTQTS